jgi:hypothetical protein
VICLRILARDNLLDDIGELFNVEKTTVHELFLTFIRNMPAMLLSEYVKVPVGIVLYQKKRLLTKLRENNEVPFENRRDSSFFAFFEESLMKRSAGNNPEDF